MNLMDKFKCECGHNELMEVRRATHITSDILEVEDGYVGLDDDRIWFSGGQWYECNQCGFKPEDEDGDYISTEYGLYVWLHTRFGEPETEPFAPTKGDAVEGLGGLKPRTYKKRAKRRA